MATCCGGPCRLRTCDHPVMSRELLPTALKAQHKGNICSMYLVYNETAYMSIVFVDEKKYCVYNIDKL